MELFDIENGCKVFLEGYIQGLESEKIKVSKVFFQVMPDTVLISISPDELVGLKKISRNVEMQIGLSPYEEVFARKLAVYGKVTVPPQELIELIKITESKKIPVHGIDCTDDEYSNYFVENVGFFEWIMQGIRIRRLRKKRFKSKTPEEFVVEWDKTVNRYKGFRKLESLRAKKIAQNILEFIDKYRKILVFVNEERKADVQNELRAILSTQTKK